MSESRTCTSKTQYPTDKKAASAMRALQTQKHIRNGVLSTYRCVFCDKYHYGHISAENRIG